jgi:putative NADH-flavin reductase
MVLGAAGSLGRHVVQQAIVAGHEVAVAVRTPARLSADVLDQVSVHQCDVTAAPTSELAALLAGHDAVINAAGNVTEGQGFVNLVERVVIGLEALAAQDRPACWFLAGAGLLDIDDSGRRGVDLPRISAIYWPHRVNFERLRRSNLDWRLLCPGPMVEQPAIGLATLRTSLDRLPVRVPALARALPGVVLLPLFARLIPEMIIPYADAAAVMLAHLGRAGEMSCHRVGIALPIGMRGKKHRWTARPKDAGSPLV